MLITIDIHGVIDRDPDFFARLSKSVVMAGHDVHIVTGISWSKEVEQELIDYGVYWTGHHSIEDSLFSFGHKFKLNEKGDKIFGDHIWNAEKGIYCAQTDSALHYDDTLAYKKHFTTPFILWE